MLRVLLVDDEPFIVQGLAVLIDWEKEGFKIAARAANGAEALAYLRENTVDLILADIKMPVMTGIELLKIIRTEKISDAYFVILSGYSDFDFAQQAIRFDCTDYILKPIRQEELTALLHKVAKMFQTTQEMRQEIKQKESAYLARNIISLLTGKYDQANLDYVTGHLRLSGAMRYVQIEIDDEDLDDEGVEDRKDGEKRALQRRLYDNCMEYLGEDYASHCIFDVSNYEERYDIGFLYCSAMAREQGADEENYLGRILRHAKKDIDAPVVMFVGKQVGDITKISESYRTVLTARSFQAFRANQNIYYYEEESPGNASGSFLCKDILDRLIFEIERNNRDEIEREVEALYREMGRAGMDHRMVNLNINYLLFQLLHLASGQDANVNQEEIMHRISVGVFERRVMRGSKEYLKHFALAYAQYLMQLHGNVSNDILKNIERDVKEHYMDNLTLKELSGRYYVNSAYLGQIFRKKYEISFKDYLNNYRIEQAANLLARTDLRVYEIAEEVGYHNLDYFINRFIINKGCTPAKYRKQFREPN